MTPRRAPNSHGVDRRRSRVRVTGIRVTGIRVTGITVITGIMGTRVTCIRVMDTGRRPGTSRRPSYHHPSYPPY